MDKNWVLSNWPILLTCAGWLYTLIVDHTEIKALRKEVEELKANYRNFDEVLEEINKKLTEVSTKISLVLDGKVNIRGE